MDNASGAAAADATSSGPQRRAPFRGFVLWMLLGAGLGTLATLVFFALQYRDPTPPLTPEIFNAALTRWKAAAPPNYDIEIRVTGPQAATYRAQVRGGKPHAAWRNDAPLTSLHSLGTWSVPGMFGTISRDIEAIERRAAGRAMPGSPELILKAEFDPQYSYPRRYRRIEWGSRRGSDAVTVTWEVVGFRVQ